MATTSAAPRPGAAPEQASDTDTMEKRPTLNATFWNFLGRLLVPTLLMGAATWYWMSLWDARMRDQNLILIQPVVFVVYGAYILIILFEIRRYRKLIGDQESIENRPLSDWYLNKRLHFMAVAGVGAALFSLAGAIPATLFAVLFGMLVLGVRKIAVLAIVPIVTTAALWAIFVQGFAIQMPLLVLP